MRDKILDKYLSHIQEQKKHEIDPSKHKYYRVKKVQQRIEDLKKYITNEESTIKHLEKRREKITDMINDLGTYSKSKYRYKSDKTPILKKLNRLDRLLSVYNDEIRYRKFKIITVNNHIKYLLKRISLIRAGKVGLGLGAIATGAYLLKRKKENK